MTRVDATTILVNATKFLVSALLNLETPTKNLVAPIKNFIVLTKNLVTSNPHHFSFGLTKIEGKPDQNFVQPNQIAIWLSQLPTLTKGWKRLKNYYECLFTVEWCIQLYFTPGHQKVTF